MPLPHERRYFPSASNTISGSPCLPAMKDVNLTRRVGGHRRDTAEFPTVRQRFRFFAEANVDAVLQQTAFVRIPSLLLLGAER